MTWERAGVDPFLEPMEWIPASYATLVAGGGIHIDQTCKTNLPFVFAAGDITCIPPHGTYSIAGINLAFCAISGRQAAESACLALNERSLHSAQVSDNLLQDRMRVILSRLDTQNLISTHEMQRLIQRLIIPREVGYLKSPAALEAALEEADRLEKEDLMRLGASCGHTLMRVLECRSMLRVAQVMVKASLLRTESRGFHFREDYPMTDNVNWLKWVMMSKKPGTEGVGGIFGSTKDVPMTYYAPSESYSVPPGVRNLP